ncbi:chalcone and stilbene synthase family protein [Wolffia australiana]
MGSAIEAAGSTGKACILAMGKAFPNQLVMQDYLVDSYFKDIDCTDSALKQKLAHLCKSTTVKTRYVVMNEEILSENPSLLVETEPTVARRLELAQAAVTQMATEAARACLAQWARPASEITHLVYVSSSEARFPGGDVFLAQALDLSPATRRLALFFSGCSGGVLGLRAAKDLAENNPGSRILLATAETTLLGFKPPSQPRAYDLVGAALFGDGAAAVLLGAAPFSPPESPLLELHLTAQILLPNTHHIIDGRLSEHGVGFKLDRALPLFIEAEVEGFCKGLLSRGGLSGLELNGLFWAVHPGGPAILNRVESRLGLLPDRLAASRRALRDFGNASSNTIVYVLEYILEERRKALQGPGWGLVLAFGPGITFEGILARSLV